MDAERRQRRRRRRRALGRGDDVGADPDHDGEPIARHRFRLQQDAGELLPPRQHVIGPFQRKLHVVRSRRSQRCLNAYFLQRRLQRESGGKSERRRDRRRNVDHFENAAGEIATRRDPGAMPPSASRGLLRGHEPDRPRSPSRARDIASALVEPI